MNSKYKIVIIIISLLIILSVSISTINYVVSLNNAQQQLKTQSLPLSLDNIYTDIQKHIIEPYLVSSMMANDTFVQDWLIHEEENSEKIIKYLEAIKNKYNMFNTFLVSDKTKNYYTQGGFIEKVQKTNEDNMWYFEFKNLQEKHEINLDFNEHLSNNLIMFINYKILNNDFQFLGATGVALKISYIDDMLKDFRINHNFIVTFFDKNGNIVLSEREQHNYKNINQRVELTQYKDLILSKNTHLLEYEKNNTTHILNTKYIPELDLYLIVEANLDNFTKDVKNIFYFNIIMSLIITIVVALIVYFLIKNYSSKLEYLSNNDPMTGVSNRRDFEEKLHHQVLLHKRDKKNMSVVFIDIDNFKSVNDKLGHNKGDLVIKQVAKLLQKNIRQTDIIARWGGEEFVIILIDSSLENSKIITEKLRKALEDDFELKAIVNHSITASFGITMIQETDTQEQLISRADEAMYLSKENGKNRVTVI